MSEGHNPYAPPLAEVKDAPQTGQLSAGRGMRFVAALVDCLHDQIADTIVVRA